MREFIDIMEVYSKDNVSLLNYMKDSDIDIYNFWDYFSGWASTREDIVDYLEKLTGIEIDSENYEDIENIINLDVDPGYYYNLPIDIQKEFVEYISSKDSSLMSHHTKTAFTLENDKLLKRLTWLIHFTNEPFEICKHGFIYGVDNISNLGLTVYLDIDDKKHGGYNFAFKCENIRTIKDVARKNKYGKHAVIFQNSGVDAYHYGDEENQVIFYGPDVKKENIIPIHNNGEYEIYDRSGDKIFYKSDDIRKIINWIMNNYNQYRNSIQK